ncbi:nose resistant to fluoxetine protein 6-like [Vanessa cardui]|uniref:nose resistant to fluoxetine protein 6-like n=1 Tax=Vanessa cardui TaxID=171605 RepID=UPI001F13E366|nr:nose resistant to fluoxetine protein 6-like [Vanessa cardui]
MYKEIFIVANLVAVTVNANFIDDTLKHTSAFDQELYESVLNPMKCEEQLNLLMNNTYLGMQFIDASGKIPSGILVGNLADLGSYHQCLNIQYLADELDVQGKYCLIHVPLNQNTKMDNSQILDFGKKWSRLDNYTSKAITRSINLKKLAHLLSGTEYSMISRALIPNMQSSMILTLAICVPKVCTPKQVINLIGSLNNINLTFDEYICRLPNDKPVSVADYLSISIFSLILLITIISTSYDLYQTYVLKKETSEIDRLYRSFSIHTNTKRLLSFNYGTGALECVDGIRAISMLWVIFGHTYCLTALNFVSNAAEILTWLTSFRSIWVNSAPISVDTFFMLSGILCVYTVIGKISRWKFIKSLHLFYLYRLLRIFPLLAAVILLQASILHRVSDGPVWTNVGSATESCRRRWWSALLHVQNYVKPLDLCLQHTWYLSVDVQLYIISPVVIVWLFGSAMVAWCSLVAGVVITLAISSVYSFMYNYSAAVVNPRRFDQMGDYFVDYYMNTLPRASPFFIGMLYGYLLHKFKGRNLRMQKSVVATLWALSIALMAFCIFSIYPIMQVDHDEQMFDNFLNAYMRGIWAMTLGWLIFACVYGYGGPINWFLSLQIWKLPARLSYAMYLIHFPLIMIANGSMTSTVYFDDASTMFRGVGNVVFTILAAFILCVFIDAPFSTVQKLLLERG